ncbi:MAG: PIN domain-containing protein [Nitriliruptoraceae bacterium]
MTRPAGALVAVLDANVLYPQWLRDVLLTLAAMGYHDPVWSEQIIDEMRRNVLHDHPDIDPHHFDTVTIAALRRAFPTAWTDVPASLITEMDNAPGDRHVLAAAVAAGAEVVVTANTGDFHSDRFVASGQIRIEDPAVFLTAALVEHDDVMAAVPEHLAANRRGVHTVSDVLDELDRNHALQRFVRLARTRLL